MPGAISQRLWQLSFSGPVFAEATLTPHSWDRTRAQADPRLSGDFCCPPHPEVLEQVSFWEVISSSGAHHLERLRCDRLAELSIDNRVLPLRTGAVQVPLPAFHKLGSGMGSLRAAEALVAVSGLT